MPDLNKSFLDESLSAARGVFALMVGDRGAARFFDFSQRGLVSSFIALLLVLLLNFGAALGSGDNGLFPAAVQFAIFYATFFAATALYLRRIGRTDALIPFAVTSNWGEVVLVVLTTLFEVLGLSLLTLITLVAAIVISINAARLVMTLRPMQIALMVLAQTVGLVLAVGLVIVLFPPSPAELASIAAAASSRP